MQPFKPLHNVKNSATEFYSCLTELNSCGYERDNSRRYSSSQLKYGPRGATDESKDRNANFTSYAMHKSRKIKSKSA